MWRERERILRQRWRRLKHVERLFSLKPYDGRVRGVRLRPKKGSGRGCTARPALRRTAAQMVAIVAALPPTTPELTFRRLFRAGGSLG